MNLLYIGFFLSAVEISSFIPVQTRLSGLKKAAHGSSSSQTLLQRAESHRGLRQRAYRAFVSRQPRMITPRGSCRLSGEIWRTRGIPNGVGVGESATVAKSRFERAPRVRCNRHHRHNGYERPLPTHLRPK